MNTWSLLTADNSRLHQLIAARAAAQARGDAAEAQRLEPEIERRIQMIGARP